MSGKIHTVESIREMLSESNAAVERALIVLYERQTADEKTAETTKYTNGIGFNAADAEILSSFAAQVQRKHGQYDNYLKRNRVYGDCLSPKQMAIARRKVVRYAKQITEAANIKAGHAAAVEEVKRLKAEGVKVEFVYDPEADGRETAAKVVELVTAGRIEEMNEVIEACAKRVESYNAEREMWAMEAAGDREETLRDERNKYEDRRRMESRPAATPAKAEFTAIRNRIAAWANEE